MEACGLPATHLAFLRVSPERGPPLLAILTERPFWFSFEGCQGGGERL